MKKRIEVIQDENLYSLCNVMEVLYNSYHSYLPLDVSSKFKDLLDEMHKEVYKDYLDNADITDVTLIEKVEFDCHSKR